MEQRFKTALSRSGNLLTPDVIIVTDDFVRWEKRNSFLIGKDSKTIPIDKIATIDIHNTGFGTDVNIISNGEGEIIAKNFTISDAKELKSLIERLMSSPKSHSENIYTVYHDLENKEASSIKTNEEASNNTVLNSAIAEDFKLELEYKRKNLAREERKKQRTEIREQLKSSNLLVYCIKWIWLVFLNRGWKKFVFILVILLSINSIYSSIIDKNHFASDELKISQEISRLEKLKIIIDNKIQLHKLDDADISLIDLTWNVSVNNKYLIERVRNESLKWYEIHNKYYLKILDEKDNQTPVINKKKQNNLNAKQIHR